MKKRIITAVILAIIGIPLICVEALHDVFDVTVLLLAAIATFEILNMYDKEKKFSIKMKCAICFLTLLVYGGIICNFDACKNTFIVRTLLYFDFKLDLVLSIAVALLCLMCFMIFTHNFDARDLGKALLAMFYVSITFSSFTILRCFGIRFIAYLLLITCCTDIFALVFGMSFGKHKMAPTISPKKTWEGAFGGTGVALVVGSAFVFLYPVISKALPGNYAVSNFFDGVIRMKNNFFGISFVIVLTLCMSICAQIGDLVASKLKRTYVIKDYSNVFPGHGGVLDRFDSALFTSVILVVFIQTESIYQVLSTMEERAEQIIDQIEQGAQNGFFHTVANSGLYLF